MKDQIFALVANMPNELGIILLSMLPVAELRLAIPFAIGTGMGPFEAFFLAVIGNILPVPFIILFIRPIFDWMKKFNFLKKLVEKLEQKGTSRAAEIQKYEFWGLCIFVAIPLPGTGAWTGALIAAMLGMRLKNAFASIALGVLGAGIIVALLSTGVFSLIR